MFSFYFNNCKIKFQLVQPNVSGSTSANTNTTSVLDLGHHAIGTGSKPGTGVGAGGMGSANDISGTDESRACPQNYDIPTICIYGNGGSETGTNSGVDFIGNDHSHVDH